MNRTWKVFALNVKRKAIREMKALVAKGTSVSKARKLIGDQKHLRVTPNTIYNWERKLTGKSTRSKGLPVKRVAPATNNIVLPVNSSATSHITSVDLHVPGKGTITLDHALLKDIAQLAGHVS